MNSAFRTPHSASAPDPLLTGLDAAAGALQQQAAGAAPLSFPDFFRAYPPAPNYRYGRHTRTLLDELDKTIKIMEAGGTRYLIVAMPPRHGKSDIISRRLAPWILTRQPDWEIMLNSYGAQLAEDLSRDARDCFREIGPHWNLHLKADRDQVGNWGIAGHRGGLKAVGLGGAITGRGAHVLIVDDYLRNRVDAESETIRKRIWEGFQGDMVTRLAPNHAVIIVATRWHEGDLIGQILRAMEDPEFPQFEVINFPAWSDQHGWLFPERYDDAWYRRQRKLVGSYQWNALYQQDPAPREGNLLRTDQVQIIDRAPDGLRWFRGWDLASTAKERAKDDPDYTVGTLAAYDRKSERLYVRDIIRGQWTAPERDRRITRAAQNDPTGTRVMIEVVAGYKDTYHHVRNILSGIAVVRQVSPAGQGDKVLRASVLEAVFESGRVCIERAAWNDAWLRELAAFPNAAHDDQVDSLVVAVGNELQAKRKMGLSR